MKAKEYAKQYIEAADKQEVIGMIWIAFMEEVISIAKMRNARKDSAIRSIILEQDQKWKSFCRLVNDEDTDIREDGFLNLLKVKEPRIFESLKLS